MFHPSAALSSRRVRQAGAARRLSPNQARASTPLGLIARVGGALLSVLAVVPAHAQDDQRRLDRALRSIGLEGPDDRLRVDTSLELQERWQLDVGGFISTTGIWLNDSTSNSRRLFQPEAVVFARANIDGVHQVFVRARFAYRNFSSGDSFDGRGDRWIEPFFDRYWYEFDLRKAREAYAGESPEQNFNIRVGRQFVDWGAGLALSETLFAVRPTVEFSRRARVEGLFGITPDHTTDFDASRYRYDDKTRRLYSGLKLTVASERGDEFYGYILDMRDKYNDNRTRTTPILDNIDFRYDAVYFALGSQGSFDKDWLYQAEVIWQSGESASDPFRLGFSSQTRESINAFAGKGSLTYLVGDASASRVQGEIAFFSGDVDRNISTDTVGGNLIGTTDRAFNALGYANAGLAFAPALSNLVYYRLGASTTPFPDSDPFRQLQVGIDGFLFTKFERRGPIDEPTSANPWLGSEVDLYANWRLTSDLALNLRYGAFFPGAAITTSRNTRHFVLISATLSF